MEYQKCLLCGERDATKTNSHIVPSFLVALVCSYDGSGKRDREIMFTMTPYEEKVYTGQIPDTKYEDLFDMEKLTDERIEKELKDNMASKDYIFCPICEKMLSDILETPYAQHHKCGGRIAPDRAYMFWLSIVWRLSVSEQFGFRLPIEIEQDLGRHLNLYMSYVSEESDVKSVVNSCPFRYRLVIAIGSNANEHGFLGGHYNYDYDILTYTIGDMIICAQFSNGELPEKFEYYGFEEFLRKAPLNDGIQFERYISVDGGHYDRVLHNFVQCIAHKKILAEKEKAQIYWNAVVQEGTMPVEIMSTFIRKLYDEDAKPGDRHSNERYVSLFNEVLQSFGYIPKEE